MSNLWFVYKSDNYEGIQFNEEVYTHYEEADKKRIKKLKTFINAQTTMARATMSLIQL